MNVDYYAGRTLHDMAAEQARCAQARLEMYAARPMRVRKTGGKLNRRVIFDRDGNAVYHVTKGFR